MVFHLPDLHLLVAGAELPSSHSSFMLNPGGLFSRRNFDSFETKTCEGMVSYWTRICRQNMAKLLLYCCTVCLCVCACLYLDVTAGAGAGGTIRSHDCGVQYQE